MTRMRLVVTSDWHLDAVTCGVERRDEIEKAVVDGPVRTAIEGKADLFCFLGDLCDPGGRSSVHDAAFAIHIAQSLARWKVASVWLAGNHDVVMRPELHSSLDPLFVADVSDCFVAKGDPRCLVLDGGVRVLMLPYSHREQDRPIVGSVADEIANDKPLIVLGHCTEMGTIHEDADYSRGRAHPWPSLPRKPLFAANGHYHEPTQIAVADVDGYIVHVPGSIVPLTFGDSTGRRGFLQVDLEVT